MYIIMHKELCIRCFLNIVRFEIFHYQIKQLKQIKCDCYNSNWKTNENSQIFTSIWWTRSDHSASGSSSSPSYFSMAHAEFGSLYILKLRISLLLLSSTFSPSIPTVALCSQLSGKLRSDRVKQRRHRPVLRESTSTSNLLSLLRSDKNNSNKHTQFRFKSNL